MFVKSRVVFFWNIAGIEPSDPFEPVSILSLKQPDQVSIALYSLLVEFSYVVASNFSQIAFCQAVGPE